MKNKFMKKFLSLILAGSMLIACVGCGQETKPGSVQTSSETQSESKETSETVAETNELSWLHPGQVPIVEEGTKKTLSIYVQAVGDKDVEERWGFQFIEEVLNIDLEVTTLTNENAQEQISLAFASGEMPDIFLTLIDLSKMLKYGLEGQIVDLAPYINEVNTPNLARIYKEMPSAKAAVTDTEGHIWGIGTINTKYNTANIGKVVLNYDWLEQVGKEVPKTLDEFTEVLRAFKTLGDDIYPLGGGYNNYTSTMSYILQAYGYIHPLAGGSMTGIGIALKDGEAILPVADREGFADFIKYYNMLYSEGLIHPDFFTMDAKTAIALCAEGKTGVWGNQPGQTVGDAFTEWWAGYPLTSDYNDTPQTPVLSNVIRANGAVISSNCEDVELALAFLDYFYNITDDVYENNITEWQNGPREDVDYGFESDVIPRLKQADGTYKRESFGTWASDAEYRNNEIQFTFPVGLLLKSDLKSAFSNRDAEIEAVLEGLDNPEDARLCEALSTDKWLHYMTGLYLNYLPYATEDVFPSFYYFDEDTSKKTADILAAIKEYATVEFARFVTGDRPLTDAEFKDFFDTIDSLGAQEYEQIFNDYWQTYKKNMN